MAGDDLASPVKILADERVERIDRGSTPPPDDWASRALYIGERGARNCLGVVHEPSYQLRDPRSFDLAANRLAAVQGWHPATFISLGPGDGLNELELVQALGAQGPGKLTGSDKKGTGTSKTRSQSPVLSEPLRYIPVDLSLALLREAIANMRPHAEIPVGILADFENSGSFLDDALRRYAHPPTLFSLLGATVANLDAGEQPFFAWIRSLLGVDDRFLVEFPLAGPAWAPATEPRLQLEAYTPAFRHFIGDAIDRSHRETTAAIFDHRVELSLSHDTATGAEVILVTDRLHRRPLLTFRRYHWEFLLHWLQSQGFTVEFARSSIASVEDTLGMGVVLLSAR